MSKAAKLIATIEAITVPESYQLTLGEINAIHDHYPGLFEIMCAAFDYGFLKGQRYAANERRKKRMGGATA